MSRQTAGATVSIYDALGVVPVINASGIYTDLGGSRLTSAVWDAVEQSNHLWASMPDVLDHTGERIAELLGLEAARVVPGAAAGLALGVGACIAGHEGPWMEQLPDTKGMPRSQLVMQRGHRYKYTRCALMSGAELKEVGHESGTSAEAFADALDDHVACVLHPAHLDGESGTLPLPDVARIAHEREIPVVVDAAYMSYPISLIGSYGDQGADLTVLSAKYFWGPNAGGFIYGRRDLVAAVGEIDFTRFESGQHLIFGRAFKMDRATVVATVVALQEWCQLDHDARWDGYRQRADAIIAELPDLPATVRGGHFTLDERIIDEPVNAVLVEPTGPSALTAACLDERLRSGNPSIRAVTVGNVLALCLETIDPGDEQRIVVQRLASAFNG